MSKTTTVRLPDETAQRLAELAAHASSQSAALVEAIDAAWSRLRERQLDQAYAAAVAANPDYPYESKAEREAMRAQRNRRMAGEA